MSNFRGAMIGRLGRDKLADTSPERAAVGLFEFMGLGWKRPPPIPRDGELMRPDFQVRDLRGSDEPYVHVDGHPSHWTKRGLAKGDWVDATLLEATGNRSLRLPAELLLGTHRDWWYVGLVVRAFLENPSVKAWRVWP